jgi:hypothetical protein
MIDPQVLKFVNEEYAKAFNTIVLTDATFSSGQENCDVMVEELRRQQIPMDEWVENVFLSIYMQLKSKGVFQWEESKADRAARLRAEYAERDRAGLLQRDVTPAFDEPATIAQQRILRERKEQAERDAANNTSLQAQDAARRASENDFSSLPTWKELADGGCQHISNERLKALSIPQTKEYRSRMVRAREFFANQPRKK